MCVDTYVALGGQFPGISGSWNWNPAWQAWWQCLYPQAMLTLLILTSLGDDALPNGLDVTFEVTELRRLTGSYNTMVGNNEGSMVGHGSIDV